LKSNNIVHWQTADKKRLNISPAPPLSLAPPALITPSPIGQISHIFPNLQTINLDFDLGIDLDLNLG
jgi:hypothetical protein